MKKTAYIASLSFGIISITNAAMIAGYDFTLTSGDTTPAALVVASGATVSELTGVGGADTFIVHTGTGDSTGEAASGTTFGATTAGSFRGVSQSMTGTSLATAITDGDYLTFTVTADVPGTLDLTGFSIDKAINLSNVGRVADEWNVLAKVNGDASAWSVADALLTDQTTTIGEGLTAYESTFIDISDSSSFGTAFQGIDSIEFRIYLWGASGALYSNAGGIDQVVVEGSVPSVERNFNLAKFQTNSASSAVSAAPARYGNDGFVTQDNRWTSNGSGPHWYRVKLAVPMTIGSAHLYSGGAIESAIQDLSLQYYNGSAWTDIAGTSTSGNTLPALNLMFDAPITAQEFRVYTTDASAVIRELALYPPSLSGSAVPFGTDLDLNVAKLRQYAYSSLDGANYPGLAIDGYVDDSSAWRSEDTAGPHTFEVHFPQSELMRGIHLYSGLEGQSATVMEDFTVDYWNGSAWVTFSDGSVAGNTDETLSLWFGSSVAAKKVRIRTTDSKQAVIRELVVFGENGASSYPLWTDALDEAPPTEAFLDYEDSYYTIENRDSGDQLQTSTSGSVMTSDEPWFQVLLNLGTDTYRLRSKDSEACFEVELASTAEGAAIIEGDYSSMPHQRWRLEDTGDGTHFKIVNVWSGLVLGLNGTAVVQQSDTGALTQQWKINYETHYPKKGQASHLHFNTLFQPGWAYNWKIGDESLVDVGQYMPMQWGGAGATSPDILKYQPTWYSRANQTTVLGFNEPDLHDQANMTETTAAYQWPRLQRMRLPLAGPVPAAYKGAWRQEYEGFAVEQGLRSEYMAMHWYSISGAASGSPSTLINNMQTLYNTYGKPIWLTEFSTRDFVGDKTTWSRNHNYNFLAEFMWRAESLPWLKKWSIFEWGISGGDPDTTDASSDDPADMNSPRLSLHYNNDKTDPGWEDLAECGLLLAGWDGNDYLVEDTSYIIHNKARFLRLIDHPDSASVSTATVLHRGESEQFILESAPSGRNYITGLSDGRRLSYNGSSVGLAASGTIGTTVEWELVEHQHGWFYIEHPSTSRRLRITNSNTIDTVSDSTANDNVRFRFIKHYLPISMTEVQTVPYAESFENGIGAWRQFDQQDRYWELGSGGTPSEAAGPSGASDGDSYLFSEGHDAGSYITNSVECTFDLSETTTTVMSFDYHMYGNYIEYLSVDIYDGTTWIEDVWIKNGKQHTGSDDPWSNAVVDLSSFTGNSEVTIRFRTANTQYNSADPAIDNIRIELGGIPLPYYEGFESGIGAWGQLTEHDYDWTHHTGGTETPDAGPSGAASGDYYLYAEGHHGLGSNKVGSVKCTFDFSEVQETFLTFDYHMRGYYIDYLAVDIHDGTSWTNNVWFVDNQQHSSSEAPWSSAKVDLSSYTGNEAVTIRFRTANTQYSAADPAIDNIRIGPGPQKLPYAEDFEEGLGAWEQSVDDDFDWTHHTGGTESPAAGPDGASSGAYYMYAEGHHGLGSDKTASLQCVFDFSLVHETTLSFDYHMYGNYIDYLAVDVYDGITWTEDVWVKNGKQHMNSSAPWSSAIVDLTSFTGNDAVRIRFRTANTQWNSADPAIDNIRIGYGPFPIPYAESFEGGYGGWEQATDDDYDWTRQTGSTETEDAGPDGASDGSYYLYAEGNHGLGSNKTSSVQCAFDFSSVTAPELSFDYHMFGYYIDYLALDVHDGIQWTQDVWIKDNRQHFSSDEAWSSATVDLSVYAGNGNVTLRFRTANAQYNAADPAIDNIQIVEALTPIESWRQQHFGSTANAGDAADSANPDFDSFNNLLEFALGTNPSVFDSPYQSMTTGESAFQLDYTRRKSTGYSIYAEWSPNLQPDSWDTVGLTEEVIGDDGEVETVTVTVPYAVDQDQKFVRIVVE